MIPQMAADRDWSAYNHAQAGRRPRALLDRALAATGPVRGRRAVDLGCGAGIEAARLATLGWRVSTIDPDPSVAAGIAALVRRGLPIEHTTARAEDLDQLPSCDLLVSNVALPHVPRARFDRVWSMLPTALEPGGVLAVDLFGVHDDWCGVEGTFLARAEVDALVRGLEVLTLDEQEHDGASLSGVKHWHTFEVIARRPSG